ncbi:MAG: DHA2 family efflux MFS transporter permease subunit [Candidatus Eremiobacteraeota bacterium]|nr:DHA2 family efflux MFS transporter permease subunit [Candidatus Eremiobacteraeota bacterium]
MSAEEQGWRRTVVVAAAMLAALLQLADTTIVNVAVPTIDGNLGASVDEGTWFITAYIIANVVVIPLSPWLSSRFGRTRYFALSIAGFTVASMLCGLANDVPTEVAFRFVQGAFGGGLMVPAQQIIRDAFPPKQLGLSQALFGLAATIGPTIGPTLGGLLTDGASWRWVFFINLIPGIVATALVVAFVRDPDDQPRAPIDVPGIALLAVGLGALQYVLEEGERNDWLDDGVIRATLLVAVVGLAAFVWWETRGTRTPAVALNVLRKRTVWASALVSFAVGYGLYGVFAIFPFYTQGTLGFTPTLSGLLIMSRAGTLVALFPFIAWLVSRPKADLRLATAAGLAIYAVASWLQAAVMTPTADFNALLATQVAGGLGLALVFVPLNVALLRALGNQPAAIAPSLAIARLAQQIGGSIATATVITAADRAFAFHDSALRGGVTLANPVAAAAVAAHAKGIEVLAQLVAQQASVLSYADAMRLIAIVAAISAPLPFLLRRQRAAAA